LNLAGIMTFPSRAITMHATPLPPSPTPRVG
jgi:hypothetical protein